MTPEQIDRVRASFNALMPRTPELVDRFHVRLFAQHPVLRALAPREIAVHKQDFAAGLRLIVKNVHRFETLEPTLKDIGARLFRAGVAPAHYGLAREVLLSTMREMSGQAWSEQTGQDWTEALNAVVSMMILGAARARAGAA